MHDQRSKTFIQRLVQNKLDGFIVTNHFNIFYLCNFKGVSPTEREAILIFSPKPTLITARLYQAEALRLKNKNFDVKIVTERNQIFEDIKKLLSKAKRLGFEEEDLKVSELTEFKKNLPKVKLVATKNFVEDLRIIKSEDEFKRIEKAQVISQKAFSQLIKTIKIGQSEAEIADRLSQIIKDLGGQGLAFESIVASGPNAALPHYLTGNRQLAINDTLLLDFGAKYKDYCADISRTVFVGKVDTQKANIYQLVAKAQKEAITSITRGIKASHPYRKAYGVFKSQNLHDYFLHSLGHGIGLEVHERPRLRPVSTQDKATDEKLLEGMVFSVEPGLYFPEWGGVRIEDLVVVKNGRAKVLGDHQTELIVI